MRTVNVRGDGDEPDPEVTGRAWNSSAAIGWNPASSSEKGGCSPSWTSHWWIGHSVVDFALPPVGPAHETGLQLDRLYPGERDREVVPKGKIRTGGAEFMATEKVSGIFALTRMGVVNTCRSYVFGSYRAGYSDGLSDTQE